MLTGLLITVDTMITIEETGGAGPTEAEADLVPGVPTGRGTEAAPQKTGTAADQEAAALAETDVAHTAAPEADLPQVYIQT